jgi:serine/threonine protein kinase
MTSTDQYPRFSDDDFVQISDRLLAEGHLSWSLRPRIFTLLHLVGREKSMDQFLQNSKKQNADFLTDIDLPISVDALEQHLGPLPTSQNLTALQKSPTTDLIELERPDGKHLVIQGSSDNYFRQGRPLGSGRHSRVEEVQSRLSLKHYALKKIKWGETLYENPQSLANEIAILGLKALSHRHLVQLIGSFTDDTYIALLQFPVASTNLASFLDQPQDSQMLLSIDHNEYRNILRSWFGCLANALAFLHGNGVRHKDIKPANILISRLAIYLTDFGLATQWNEDTKSHTTKEAVGAFTPKYAAPEVMDDNVSS